MFSSSALFLVSLLASPTLSIVLPPDSNLLDTAGIPEPNTFPALLTSPQPPAGDSNTINRPKSLSDLNLTTLTSQNTIALTRIPGSLNLTTSSSCLLRRAVKPGPNAGTTLLRATGASFLAPITLGNQTFNVIVDTGSSDTWVVNKTFICVDVVTNRTIPNGYCRFAGTYDMGREGSGVGNKFKKVDDVNFNVTYGDGEYLTGILGTLDVSLAGVKVPGQQVALATLAAWQGDGQASGIVGLGFPALTGSYSGPDPRTDQYCHAGQTAGSGCNQAEYDPLLTNAFFDCKVATAVFSLALSRDESNSGKGGHLSIGGIPDLEMVNAEGGKNAQFASADLKMIRGDDRYRYYLVEVEGVVVGPAGSESASTSASASDGNDDGDGMSRRDVAWPGRRRRTRSRTSRSMTSTTTTRRTSTSTSTSTTTTTSTSMSTSTSTPSSQPTILPSSPNTPLILDSGTTLTFLPPPQTRKILSLFSPPSIYDPSTGFWFVSCTATPPSVGIKLGGHIFYANAKDLVKHFDRSRCISGVQEAAGGLEALGAGILGDTWLDSVLVVFDFRGADKGGGGVVRVAARREYVS